MTPPAALTYAQAAAALAPDASDVADIAIGFGALVRVDASYGSVYEGTVEAVSAKNGWMLVRIGRYCEWFSTEEVTLLITAAAMVGEGT